MFSAEAMQDYALKNPICKSWIAFIIRGQRVTVSEPHGGPSQLGGSQRHSSVLEAKVKKIPVLSEISLKVKS